ncbi:putative Serine/threonine protein kinase [Nostocoides australiense Ben110]|uniref:Putative Serine/threonine protein kinase n=1 Tax=Nostocoides australiense Ben110 TaxID=1193182 RepID=W6K091_9MICO|nr:hypothetical protein [Tetrasphaera australiensis]CCH74892.1 putative Serine/threonine protein kinase [Tetrasphaera australiensis Ben110]
MADLAEPPALFMLFEGHAGGEANARSRFQSLVTALVSVVHPAANEVAGPGGRDWGIDTFVGRLDDDVVVWQSKYFRAWNQDSHPGEIRNSFKSLMTHAQAHDVTVSAWTLCVPCILSPEGQRWFDGWRGRQEKQYGLTIDLWNGVRLRRLLASPDGEQTYRDYFPGGVASPEPVMQTTDVAPLTDALFVRQLEEAGWGATDAARGMFFAAEALARDIATRKNTETVQALRELHLEVQAAWESKYNQAQWDHEGRMAGLVDAVLTAAECCPDPYGLSLRPSHRKGVAHRLVEDRAAGWVRHWSEVAASHTGPDAHRVVDSMLAAARGSSDA